MIGEKYINVLYIDLSNQSYRYEKRGDLVRLIGGSGIAAKLLDENIKPELDPLHPDQSIVFAIGPLNFIMPACTKVVSAFYSPHTNEYGESHAGGRLGMAMRFAGLDAIVITGKPQNPQYLVIDDKVSFKDARAMWGMSIEDTGKVLRNFTEGNGVRSSLRIGRAGENLITYSCVNVDTYRHFGRLGLGAVFGSKFLKGMVIIGDNSIKIPMDIKKSYTRFYDQVYDKLMTTDIMEKYHGIGTAINIIPLNESKALPTLNLASTQYEFAEEISGEGFAQKNLIRKLACAGCPVGCIHIGNFRRKFSDSYDFETIQVSYDYELIFSLGSFLGIKSSDEVLMLIDVVEGEGLDAISTGISLGWATEAYRDNLIGNNESIVPLMFGDAQNYIEAVHYIAKGENEFYRALGRGVDYSSKIYGGEEYACHLGGNEMPGYHTGYGSVVGFSVGSRHSHLDNGGYSFDQESTADDEIIEKIFNEEIERNILTSLVACLFARKVYTMDKIIKALNSIGMSMDENELISIGREILKMKYDIKKRLGYSLDQIRLPKRFFNTNAIDVKLDSQKAHELIKQYKNKIESLYN